MVNAIKSPILMVAGIGGGGIDAVNHIYSRGNSGISFFILDTDRQSLGNSPVPDDRKMQLGDNAPGAGSDPSKASEMAEDLADEIEMFLRDTGVKMVFVVAAMGGGTGTGAAPVVARIAKSMGILTIGIVTIPFESESHPRLGNAIKGVEEMSWNVDSLIIINHDHINGHLPTNQAFYQSNEMISKSVKGISDIINTPTAVNVDFADIYRAMKDSGEALVGFGTASGENRAVVATEKALTSPLFHNQDIRGAKCALLCMTSSSDPEHELKMNDAMMAVQSIQKCTGKDGCPVIWGVGYDDSLGDAIHVTVIMTGLDIRQNPVMRYYHGDGVVY